jgi:hypothetical protein
MEQMIDLHGRLILFTLYNTIDCYVGEIVLLVIIANIRYVMFVQLLFTVCVYRI